MGALTPHEAMQASHPDFVFQAFGPVESDRLMAAPSRPLWYLYAMSDLLAAHPDRPSGASVYNHFRSLGRSEFWARRVTAILSGDGNLAMDFAASSRTRRTTLFVLVRPFVDEEFEAFSAALQATLNAAPADSR